MKFIALLALTFLTSTFAAAASLELNDTQSTAMMKLLESSGAETNPDGRTLTVYAKDVYCILERSVGVSCNWKIKELGAKKLKIQNLSQKKADTLYDLLNSSGLSPELDGRTAQFRASQIVCFEERMLGVSCIVTE